MIQTGAAAEAVWRKPPRSGYADPVHRTAGGAKVSCGGLADKLPICLHWMHTEWHSAKAASAVRCG